MARSPRSPGTSSGRRSRRRLRFSTLAWMFMGTVVCLLAFAYYSMHLLAATRAYVGGESRWSKAQKEMIYRLGRYARYQNVSDWTAFQDQHRLLAGADQARTELARPQPDWNLVEQGFIQSGNHPDDVDGMVHLYRNFRWVDEIEQAVRVWTEADVIVKRIGRLGDGLHAAVLAGNVDATLAESTLQELHIASEQLAPLEDAFSEFLGSTARRTRSMVLIGLLLLASALVGGSAVVARRMLAQNERMQRVLARGEQQLRSLIKVAPMPLAIVRTVDNSFVYANDQALAQFQVKSEDLGSHPPRDMFFQPSGRDGFWSNMLLEGRLQDFEVQLQSSAGEPFWALVSAERVVYAGADCVVIAVNNIEQRRRAHEAMRHRAFHDELTGLPNRAHFMEGLQRTMSRLDRKGASCAVLFIDLDHFKDINDTYGHAAGDVLLKQVARRIRYAVREGDLVARLGGDEFVVLIEDAASGELGRIAQNLLDALQQPYAVGEGVQVQVTSSIGISSYPRDGKDLESLVKNADHAMYLAKAQGRNNFQFSENGSLPP